MKTIRTSVDERPGRAWSHAELHAFLFDHMFRKHLLLAALRKLQHRGDYLDQDDVEALWRGFCETLHVVLGAYVDSADGDLSAYLASRFEDFALNVFQPMSSEVSHSSVS